MALIVGLCAQSTVAGADPFSLESLLDDTAVPEAPTEASVLWPSAAVLDSSDQSLTLRWPDQTTETLPFAAIVQLEHARAWDEDPDELFALFIDGRRVLLERGDGVSKTVDLLKVWLATKIVEMPIGEGHAPPPNGATAPPKLTMASAGGQLALGRLDASPAPPSFSSTACTDCMSKGDIDRIVKTRMDKIRSCYQRALRDSPGLAGQLVIKFVVGRDGGTANAVVKESSLGNQGVEQCVLEQFLLLRFPRPPNNQDITATYPLMFAAS